MAINAIKLKVSISSNQHEEFTGLSMNMYPLKFVVNCYGNVVDSFVSGG